jgi:serine/threonine protein kinase
MPCKAQPTDIFSLGVLFFMLAFGAPPFHAAVNTDCYFSFLVLRPGNKDFFKYHPHTRQLFRDKKIPESFMDLLLSMLMVEPARRIQDAGQLLESEFLQNDLSESMDLNHIMK